MIVPHCTDEISSYHGCHGITFEGKRIPEILAQAENIVLPTPFQSAKEYENHYTLQSDTLPDGYSRTEGTSYAAPVILGCAACILAAASDLTYAEIRFSLNDHSSYVKMNALFCLRNREDMWEDVTSRYGRLNDARKLKVSTFGVRCEALQRLTGIAYEPVPDFVKPMLLFIKLSVSFRKLNRLNGFS